MAKRVANTITFPLPAFMMEGLDEAAKKFKTSKSNIMRNTIYDFLVTSGTLPNDGIYDSNDDLIISAE